jgi:hypothetical protein
MEIEFDNVLDLVSVTIRDLYDITVRTGFERKTIDVECFLFGEWKTIKLPVAELMLYRNSAKGFINYLKEKMTEGLKEKLNE